MLYTCTLYTCRHVPVCFDIFYDSQSRKSTDELMRTLFTFKIPETYRICTTARYFSVCIITKIRAFIYLINITEIMLKLDLHSVVEK